ncbi:hypothetical protein A6F68_02725 [Tsuneonella dongtanensis]|uniref:Uncharacterized protein n=1 Tax=Tsuneonella dongtanensis TaxID=692370 RepID=A0A1B2AGQ3_9SPHN|nr:hypothetical protein [Tsuneonella dongtanensis]ANY21215.1 hypothetical protein A6F68_02725 [Tsuneonella dongtanensis]
MSSLPYSTCTLVECILTDAKEVVPIDILGLKMSSEFSAIQTSVNSSQLERMINRPSSVVAEFASLVGWHGLSGHLAKLDISGAINVLVLSTAADHGIEPKVLRPWLPRLRTEALVRLACDLSNWGYQGAPEDEMDFNAKLYGSEANVRAGAARLLGINLFDAAGLLRYHSSSDIECLTNEQMELGHDGRAPRFSIFASDLAQPIKEVCPSPLFIACPKVNGWHELRPGLSFLTGLQALDQPATGLSNPFAEKAP